MDVYAFFLVLIDLLEQVAPVCILHDDARSKEAAKKTHQRQLALFSQKASL